MSAKYRLRGHIPGQRPAPLPVRIHKRSFIATVAFVWLAITLCILPRPVLIPTNLRAGFLWTGDAVPAPSNLQVRDHDAEDAARRETQLRHSRVFRIDPTAGPKTLSKIDKVVEILTSPPRPSSTSQLNEVADRLFTATGVRLSMDSLVVLVQETSASLRRAMSMSIQATLSDRGVTPDRVLLDLARQSGQLVLIDPRDRLTSLTAQNILGWPTETMHVLETQILPDLGLSATGSAAVADILGDLIEPNVHYDSDKSVDQLTSALNSIHIRQMIPAGALLVRPGERLKETQIAALEQASGIYRIRNFQNAAGAAIISVLAIVLLVLYTNRYRGNLFPDSRTVLMLAMPVILAVSLGRVTENVLGSEIGPAALPVGMVGMVATILFDARFALLLSVMTPLLFSVGSTDPTLSVMLTGILTGAAGAFSLTHLRERWHILVAGVYVAIACFVSMVATGLLNSQPRAMMELTLTAGVNGLVCYGLTVMVLPFFELVFKASTSWRLLELTSGDHPVLNQLEREAPGTHEHSLNVAKLAEAACDEIGANALLARAGAYFHDVGKMLKPRYFIENQESPEDRRLHSRLTPSMSALIIRDHVRYGLELATEYKLPDRVTDFISQHHGTSTISYFLEQERRRIGPEDKLPEDVFRYQGPKPQSIEVGIVMIADSLDATAVAMFSGRNVDEDDVQKLVRDTVARLFADGQLDECPITMEQLSRLQGAFVRGLKSRFHRRINYPGKTSNTAKRNVESPTGQDDETVEVVPPAEVGHSSLASGSAPAPSDSPVTKKT
jgi:putative nucleotidyltransferase with HDIG domain